MSCHCHTELDQALYYLIGNSIIRVIVLDGLAGNATDRLLAMRPAPSYFVIFGSTEDVKKQFKRVSIHWKSTNLNSSFLPKFSGIPSVIRKIHHILILIQAVYNVYTNKKGNFQLNYTDYISLFANT